MFSMFAINFIQQYIYCSVSQSFSQHHKSIHLEHFVFLSKDLLSMSFAVFKENGFFKENSVKTGIKRKSESEVSIEYVEQAKTIQTNCNSFYLVTKETCSLALYQLNIRSFLFTNFNYFSSLVYSLGLLGAVLVRIGCLILQKVLRRLPLYSTTCIASHSLHGEHA